MGSITTLIMGGMPDPVGQPQYATAVQVGRLYNVTFENGGQTATLKPDGFPPELVKAVRPTYEAITLNPDFSYTRFRTEDPLKRYVSPYCPCGSIVRKDDTASSLDACDELCQEMMLGMDGQIVGLYVSHTIHGVNNTHGSFLIFPPSSELMKKGAAELVAMKVYKGFLRFGGRGTRHTFFHPENPDLIKNAPCS